MWEHTSIWYNVSEDYFSVECNVSEDYFSVECCECFSSYDENFEIKMPGLIFNYGES